MPKVGVNNTSLKQQNRGLVLRLIATGECSSRIELAQKTGLSKMTVTYIVNEFLEQGILEEREKVQIEGKGRNPVQLCIASGAPKLIGVHVYREKCSVVLCDMQLHILRKTEIPLNEDVAPELLDHIFQAIDATLAEADGERVYGIGIGAIGPVDTKYGEILEPPNFYGLHDLELKRETERRYQLPTYFDVESNCAAIAEKYYGNGSDCEDFIYLDLANGVGAGLVVNGQIYQNTSGMICELGHTSIDWQGIPCSCGNRGCLERYISSNVLEKQLQEAAGETKSFAEFCRQMSEAIQKKEAEGRPFTEQENRIDAIFSEMTEKLACGLVNFCNGLNPQKIIIGHEGFWLPDLYLEQTERLLNSRQIARRYRRISIVKSAFGSEATVVGCTGALLTTIFHGALI